MADKKKDRKIADFNIVDTFSLRKFRSEYKGKYTDYIVKDAVFLTYSIDTKIILALLHELFYEESGSKNNEEREIDETDSDNKMSRDDAQLLLDRIVADIYENYLQNETDDINPKEHFAVFYNNGSRSVRDNYSIADALAMQFAYSVDVKNASFHPKAYIVSYGPREGAAKVYRIMIGSHNLSNSNAIEYGYCLDTEVEENTSIDWKWLKNLLSNVDILSYSGNKLEEPCNLPVIKNIIGNSGQDQKNICNIPELITDFSEDFDHLDFNDENLEIYSPFLTASKIDSFKGKLYTTHMELEKRGYVQVGDNNDDDERVRRFHVFYPKEGTPASNYNIPHYKIYITGENAYVGSLNFTDSAFNRNKEVMIKLEKNERT